MPTGCPASSKARAVAALNHPNILGIDDIAEQNGAPYLVSELLEGNSPRVEMEQGCFRSAPMAF